MAKKIKRFANLGLEAYNSTLVFGLIVAPLIVVGVLFSISGESETTKTLVAIFGDLALVGIGYFIRGKEEGKSSKKQP